MTISKQTDQQTYWERLNICSQLKEHKSTTHVIDFTGELPYHNIDLYLGLLFGR